MPLGRPGVSGGEARWVLPLSDVVNVQSLAPWIKQKNPPPKLNEPESHECNRRLRKRISIYRIARETPQPTATERRQILDKIKTAARRFIETPKRLWVDKLLDYLEAADVNTRSILNHEIIAQGHSRNALVAMKRELRDLFSLAKYPDESLPHARAVSRASMDRLKAFQKAGLQ